MAFREVSVIQVKEALRRWLHGAGERPIANGAGLSRGAVRRYVTAAQTLGIDRGGGEEQLTDELIGQICELVRPRRPDGHGDAWRALADHEQEIKDWVVDGLTVVKIGILLRRKGVDVPHRTLARFCVERCGAGRRARTTVRVDDPPPATELQVDFGRLGLVPTADGTRRVCQALIFTACFSRHMFVWPSFAQTTEAVIEGFEAAWYYFGGVFPVVIPDSMKAIVTDLDVQPEDPCFEDPGPRHAALRRGGRVGDPPRTGRRRQVHDRPGARPGSLPARLHRGVHEDLPAARHTGRRARRSELRDPALSLGPPRRGRLR
jgi:hypothetical protein